MHPLREYTDKMTHLSDTIDHATLEQLVQTGAVRGVTIVGQPGGWTIVIEHGLVEQALAEGGNPVQIFYPFETVVGYLSEIGITTYHVDASYFSGPGAVIGNQRNGAAECPKSARKGAAYADWLSREVQDAIDDPRPSVLHGEVAAEWALERAALLKRVNSTES